MSLSHSISLSLSLCALSACYPVRPSIICTFLFLTRNQLLLAFSTQVRGFKPGRSLRIFKGEKILSTPSFGGEVKPSVPCRRFAACKRSLNGVEVVILAKLPDNILAHSPHLPPLGSLAS